MDTKRLKIFVLRILGTLGLLSALVLPLISVSIVYAAVPVLAQTGAVVDILSTSVKVPGEVTSDGGETITERGICYRTGDNVPTTANSKVTTTGTVGSFIVEVTGLTPGQLYSFRAYAINDSGTSYGGTHVTATPTDTINIYWVGGTGNWSDDDNHWSSISAYMVGTASFINGDATVEGAGGCDWSSYDNMKIRVASGTTWYTIDSITDSDTLELAINFAEANTGAVAYIIANPTDGSIPTRWKNAIIDNNSFYGASQTLTVNAAATCADLIFTGVTNTPTFAGSQQLYIWGDLTLEDTITLTYTGTSNLYDDYGTMAITTDGLGIKGSIILNSQNGGLATFQLQDNFLMNGIDRQVKLTAGTFDHNNKDITISGYYQNYTDPLENISSVYNLTVNGTNNYDCVFYRKADLTVTNNLVLAGYSSEKRLSIISRAFWNSLVRMTRTFTVENLTCSYVNFEGITGAGAADWDISACTGNSGDAGGNSNITFTSPVTLYWYQDTGDYTDPSKWFLGSGGSGGAGRVPLPQDDVIFDALSFSTTNRVVSMYQHYIGNDISFADVDAANTDIVLYLSIGCTGSFTFDSNMKDVGEYGLYFLGSGAAESFTFTCAGKKWHSLDPSCGNSTYVAQDTVYAGEFFLIQGEWDFNGNDAYCAFIHTGSINTTLNLDNGTYYLTREDEWGTSFLSINASTTLYIDYCDIVCSSNNTTEMTIDGREQEFGDITITGSGAYYTKFLSSVSFQTFTVDRSSAYKGIKIHNEGYVEVSEFICAISGSTLLYIRNETGTTYTGQLRIIGGEVVGLDYLDIAYNEGYPNGSWYYGSNSNIGASVTGWNSGEPPDKATVTTQAVTDITDTTATGNGTVVSDGGDPITERGVCWNTYGTPTILNDTETTSGTVGVYTVDITGLTGVTHYYLRAYAINGGGVAYGLEVEFDTTEPPPSITTSVATVIQSTTATGNGEIVDLNGGGNATIRGFEWDTNSGAPYANDVHENGSFGTGIYNLSITGLSSGTVIYYRAYATNPVGTGYGSEQSFLTKPAAPTNVNATNGVYTTKVTITWIKSTGATDYHVWRDTTDLGSAGDVDTFDDTEADAGVITPGNAVATDGTENSYVALSISGASTANGTIHTYKVVASNATGNSVDSDTNTGYRGIGSLSYQWQVSAADSDADYSNILGAITSTYNATEAPAGVITAGAASASDAISVTYVTLQVSGNSANAGAGRYYVCVLNASGALEKTTTSNRGYRGIGSLSYQWQVSAADSDADYSNILGATTNPYGSTVGVVTPDGRYYKVVENADGASQVISIADRGNKAEAPPPPPAPPYQGMAVAIPLIFYGVALLFISGLSFNPELNIKGIVIVGLLIFVALALLVFVNSQTNSLMGG